MENLSLYSRYIGRFRTVKDGTNYGERGEEKNYSFANSNAFFYWLILQCCGSGSK
jgi:hypothetical protein